MFTLSTPSLDVTRFRYGWKTEPEREIPAALTTGANGSATMVAQVKLSATAYGESTFTAYGVDKTLNEGHRTAIPVMVKKKVTAIARYGLQTYPGVDETAALANSARPNAENPLAVTGLGWADDVRIIGGRTATFTGATVQSAGASGLVLDTTKSFAVAAWVRLTDLNATSTLIAKDAPTNQSSPFRLRARPLSSGGNAWCLLMLSTTTTSGTEVCSTVANTGNQWAHVAAGFDRANGRVTVWVDGTGTSAAFTTPATNTGGIVLGRGIDALAGSGDRMRGNIADVQVFDRPLIAEDFTGISPPRPWTETSTCPASSTRSRSAGGRSTAAPTAGMLQARPPAQCPRMTRSIGDFAPPSARRSRPVPTAVRPCSSTTSCSTTRLAHDTRVRPDPA